MVLFGTFISGKVFFKESDAATVFGMWAGTNLDKKLRSYIRKSKLPIRVIYEHANSIKKKLVRSALVPNYCIVHEKYLEQQQGTKRRGRPRDNSKERNDVGGRGMIV